jgi:hypothetical protein
MSKQRIYKPTTRAYLERTVKPSAGKKAAGKTKAAKQYYCFTGFGSRKPLPSYSTATKPPLW